MYYFDRQTEITLKCDPTTNGTKPAKFTESGTSVIVYVCGT